MNKGAHEKIRALKESWTPAQVTAILGHPGGAIALESWMQERYEGESLPVLLITVMGLVTRGVVRWEPHHRILLTAKGHALKAELA